MGQEIAQVYAAIAKIQGDLAKVGIAKNRRNTQGSGYNFRGIDDVYAALSPLLAEHGLCVIPRMVEREVTERTSKSGGALFFVAVKAEFDFIAVADGSIHTACTYGEAMDSGDKATNKAMSTAYKYAAFLTFAIPTEGDNDSENVTHEVAPAEKVPGIHKIKERLRAMMTAGNEDSITLAQFKELKRANKDDLKAIRDANHGWWTGDGEDFEGFQAWMAKREAELDIDNAVSVAIDSMKRACTTRGDLEGWMEANAAALESFDGEDSRRFQAEYDAFEAGLLAVDTMASG